MCLGRIDEELFAMARQELSVAVIGDIMNTLGLRHQFFPRQIRPIAPHMVVIGRAMPVLEAAVFETTPARGANAGMAKPFGLMFEALDALKANEVYVCTGASARDALWGELMTTRAMRLGAAGAVVDGFLRDTKGILALNFSVFAYGSSAQNQGPRCKVVDFRCALAIDGTRVNPGDILFGDIDGVCVVPHQAEKDVFAGAIKKARGEKRLQKAIQAGMRAAEAFQKFSIPRSMACRRAVACPDGSGLQSKDRWERIKRGLQ
jgi:regulator of RNase E activity RraA